MTQFSPTDPLAPSSSAFASCLHRCRPRGARQGTHFEDLAVAGGGGMRHFRHTGFALGNETLHVFFKGTGNVGETGQGRLDAALRGRRHRGSRVVQFVLDRAPSGEAARALAADRLRDALERESANP